MPVKNTRKQYLENGYYHLYNRGYNKQLIFREEIDYKVFLSYLKDYLTPKDEVSLRLKLSQPHLTLSERNTYLKLLSLNNFTGEITLHCFGLMPNHFHFTLKQKSPNSIDKFMNSFLNRYSLYLNKKYKLIGKAYESSYKAVLIKTDEQLLELTRYIHKQTQKLKLPSSLRNYLGERKTSWIHPEEVLSFFSNKNPNLSYQDFISLPSNEEIIIPLLLEDND